MNIESLKPVPGSRKRKLRVGRGEGSGHGKTAGRGGKGQSARKGAPIRAGFEGGQMPLMRRVPKLGFTSRQAVRGTNQYNVISLSALNIFENGATVDAEALKAKGFKLRQSNRAGVKILGGTLEKKITLKVNAISSSAKTAIESKGGSVEILKA